MENLDYLQTRLDLGHLKATQLSNSHQAQSHLEYSKAMEIIDNLQAQLDSQSMEEMSYLGSLATYVESESQRAMQFLDYLEAELETNEEKEAETLDQNSDLEAEAITNSEVSIGDDGNVTLTEPEIDEDFFQGKANNEELEEALQKEQILNKYYPDWTEQLDDCPCTEEQIEQLPEFEESTFFVETYHPGAETAYRSTEGTEIYSSVDPSLPPLNAGQQCTYDEDGYLLTEGKAAGTPDAFSPNATDLFSFEHTEWDVDTSEVFDTERYHETWTPNNDNNCPTNFGDDLSSNQQSFEDIPQESEVSSEFEGEM